ncbi:MULTISPECIES: pyridoxine 5'-phosphate oxidase C-terminal domain-containing protein [Microbacterium]|uniref:Pyridoxine 5'-phosphate oxidase C-terminal domain-containing protein n=1 Tax=Microbacterium profundi TaxID=450380 RepID=A0ABV3LL79_9MICO|nr:pyridoxine 5'-phosphate oxidase C-terminal domain-containing protein [Microbacterium sp. KRD172]
MLWRLIPTRVEFWCGAVDRRHTWIVYFREGENWSHTVTDGEADGASTA